MFGLPSGIKKSSTKAMWQNSPTNVICSDKDLNLQYIPGFRENIKNPEAQIIEQVIVVLIKWIKNTNFRNLINQTNIFSYNLCAFVLFQRLGTQASAISIHLKFWVGNMGYTVKSGVL